jgi:uncharacterized membrane protein YfcA
MISAIAGSAAGCVNGIFGAGGGMILIPMLPHNNSFTQEELFSSSIVIMLPICLISLGINTGGDLPWRDALPYLIGGIPGGVAAAYFGRKIPVLWLHRCLGALIFYGGIRYLC